MAEIKIRHGGRHFICQNGTNLLDALLEAGVFVDNPCNGKGICGKCKVKVLSEGLTPMTASEERLLKPEEISEGVRLGLHGGSDGGCGNRTAKKGTET